MSCLFLIFRIFPKKTTHIMITIGKWRTCWTKKDSNLIYRFVYVSTITNGHKRMRSENKRQKLASSWGWLDSTLEIGWGDLFILCYPVESASKGIQFLGASLWRYSGHFSLGIGPGEDPDLIELTLYPQEPGNALESPWISWSMSPLRGMSGYYCLTV